MPQIKTIDDLDRAYDESELHLCQSSGEFEDLCDSVGMPRYNRQYTYGFARIKDGEVIELWGFGGAIAFVNKPVELVYDHRIGQCFFELSHAFYAIGELTKTRRFPERCETFINRVWEWLQINRPNIMPRDIARFAVIAAFNFRWLNVLALEWNGIDRESLWLER